MSIEEMLSKMKAIFPDLSRKRRRSSNCIEGPPPKFSKNVQEHRILRNEQVRTHPIRKTIIGSMGSLFSNFKSKPITCKPTEEEEYSDGEDVIFVQKFKKSDLTASRIQPINDIQSNKMDGVNNRSSATRPLPALISKTKFSKIPDLQKFIRGPPRVNGYRCENESNSSSRSCLVNGNNFSFKPLNSQHFDNTLEGRNYSNYFNSASTGGLKYTPTNLLRPPNAAAEEKLRYEKLLKSVLPDYGQNVVAPLPTSKRSSIVQNHVISGRPPIRRSVIHILDDDFHQEQEDTRRLFRESSITEQSRVTPINTMRLKVESTPVCQTAYPDILREKYSLGLRERQERISQQVEASKKLNTERVKHCNSYEYNVVVKAWRTPDFIILPEEVEEKVDDFPVFTDDQKKVIRNAMSGNAHSVLVTKFNITITRDHILTLQWEPLAWLNDEVINFYMSLLTERGELRSNDGYPKVHAMNTFFTQRLCTGGYSAVRRWTKKVDIFSCDIIPVPVHVGNVHWCMAIINMKDKTIKYYDSMGSPNNRVLTALEEYLREESLDKRKIEFDTSGWIKENVSDNPRQQNGSDCGVFSCMTAEFICRNRPIVFNQQHMNYFRQKMVLEICQGKLLL